MGLVALLIPLIPGLVSGIIQMIDVMKGHEETPEELKPKLDAISVDLKALVAKVQAVQLPDKTD